MKKLFAILIILLLSIPVSAANETEQAITDTIENPDFEQTEEVSNLNPDLTKQDVTIAEELPTTYKTPYSKKKLAKKFIIAMLCVAGCSVFLYGTLSIYNKIRDDIISQSSIPPEGEKPLDAPNDLTEAVKTFIEKTKWG